MRRPPPAPGAQPPKQKGCVFAALVIGGALPCCCLGGLLVAACDQVTRPEVALGTALVPPDLEPGAARTHEWHDKLNAYSLGYGVSAGVRAEVEAQHQELARRFVYEAGVGNNFRWTPPPRCEPQPWVCVYDELAAANADDLAPLTELFRRRQREADLDARALTELVVAFVQRLAWRLPETHFGILPPAVVVADGWGDCDSKSLLAAVILEQLGVDTVMLYSGSLAHVALGVALPGPGQRFTAGGQRYLYVESTFPGWALGIVPPEYDKPRLWEVVPFSLR